jgi:hypothetical protein
MWYKKTCFTFNDDHIYKVLKKSSAPYINSFLHKIYRVVPTSEIRTAITLVLLMAQNWKIHSMFQENLPLLSKILRRTNMDTRGL